MVVTWCGIRVTVSDHLPYAPTDGEYARRMVRHGMADILAWLGEDVGPKPTDRTHVVYGFDGSRDGQGSLMVSAEMFEHLRAEFQPR